MKQLFFTLVIANRLNQKERMKPASHFYIPLIINKPVQDMVKDGLDLLLNYLPQSERTLLADHFPRNLQRLQCVITGPSRSHLLSQPLMGSSVSLLLLLLPPTIFILHKLDILFFNFIYLFYFYFVLNYGNDYFLFFGDQKGTHQ